MNILITGGAGYIGSHTALDLLQSNHTIIVLDNLSNSSVISIRRVEHLSNKHLIFIQGDIRDRALLDKVFAEHHIDAVMHFAGLKAVGESVQYPMKYYDNNVSGSIVLCQAMAAAGVYRLVFSSSATVYGEPDRMPIAESCPVGSPTNPYGRSKLMVERMLQDMVASDARWSVALLRYFNPVGAHPSGLLGEVSNGVPNNLLPYISQVAIGQLEALSIFGNDYPTKDGTGIRDYIHVVDLAKGHLAALDYISGNKGVHIWNLGTGIGYSVLEMLAAFERASDRKIPFKIAPRRPGDVAECWADPTKAFKELGWKATRGLQTMMDDTWRWQMLNPNGYSENLSLK